jgi:peroxiredoxin-like protein
MSKSNQFLFDVQLNWLKNREGIFTSRSVHDTMKVSTPKAFSGGEEGMWSPEHLLLCSVSSCFMTTFLYYAKKAGLAVTHFECGAIGQVELREGKLHYTCINLYPVAKTASQNLLKKAQEVLKQAEADCLIARTLNTDIFYHSVAEVDAHPVTVNAGL